MRWLIMALAMLLVTAWPAAAHLTPNSEVRLDFAGRDVTAEIVVPLGELGYAMGRPISPRPGPAPPGLDRYLMQRLAVRAPDGRPWALELRELRISPDAGGPDLVAQVGMRPPPGAPLRRFDFSYGVVIDQVRNHFVMVMVRNDYAGGQLSEQPQLLGALQGGARTLAVNRGPGSAWRGFASAVGLGMRHIAEGHDHLLFLLALLLPAPLLARERRWRDHAGVSTTFRRLAGVVSAFTLGHSLTLIGGAFLGWRLPAQPVEVLIAVSILVSAIHAARPLFPGREPLVALGFGLVHGLAFATLIAHFDLEPWRKAQAILGFNLGIELVQLAVVAAVMPPLAILAHTRSYPAVRTAAAAFCGVAALAWMAERVLGVENVIGRGIDAALAHGLWLFGLLIFGTALAVLADRRGRASQA
ncbi:HupE/UreJ family protein [uncultured Phenylobacterium sp.]|uniref:HupE/UreJ family protein n=1 Tax=uncultured Phenylobacterium sp. TaxID=349273 RepID=UPI002600D014|nr:HupE/UreJ family protein [uncultured Phenylobacterium sp.]